MSQQDVLADIKSSKILPGYMQALETLDRAALESTAKAARITRARKGDN